jgi:putative molybdopterin biosynthesis protein
MNSLSDTRVMGSKQAQELPTYLTVKEVAQLLKIKPRTIYEMVAQHRIPYRKPPGSNILRFDLDEILRWLKAEVER